MRTVDPIIVAIKAFRDGNAAFCAHPEADDDSEIVAATYGPPLEVLQNWTAPAITLEGAMNALRLAREEASQFYCDGTVFNMLNAAMAYLEGDASGSGSATATDNVIDEWRLAYTAWESAVDADGEDHDEEWKVSEAAEAAMVYHPCRTLDDVRKKVRVVLVDDNVFDSVSNCNFNGEHMLCGFLRSLLGEDGFPEGGDA